MNNEEQILSMLTSMNSRFDSIDARLDKLDAGQAKLESGQAKLEASQAETNQRLEQLTVKVDNLTDKADRLEAHALHIDSRQADILGKLESLATEDRRIVESMYKFDDAGRERHIQMMQNIDVIKGVTRVNTLDIAELKATVNL